MAMQREGAIASIAEIDHLARWTRERPKRATDLVLVGGWAVHSWAPYYFSLDIDLVVRKDTRDSLLKVLGDWHFYPANPRAGEDKSTWVKDTPGGNQVVLDIAGTGPQMANTFARDRTRSIPWREAIDHSAERKISWADPPSEPALRVCDLDLLFLYKLKAFDDRTIRLNQEGDPNGYLAQKRWKDAKDVWALLELIRKQPQLVLIRQYFAANPFLADALRSAPTVRGIGDPPNQGSQDDYRELVEVFLDLL